VTPNPRRLSACDHGRVRSHEDDALAERAARSGARVVVNLGRRTVAWTWPTTGSPLRRLTAPLLLVPLLIVLFALAVLFVMLLLLAASISVALALTAFLTRRRSLRAL
jgi:hypothetical protein